MNIDIFSGIFHFMLNVFVPSYHYILFLFIHYVPRKSRLPPFGHSIFVVIMLLNMTSSIRPALLTNDFLSLEIPRMHCLHSSEAFMPTVKPNISEKLVKIAALKSAKRSIQSFKSERQPIECRVAEREAVNQLKQLVVRFSTETL